MIKLGVLTPDGEIAQSYLDKFEKPSMTEKFGGVSTFDRAKAMMENDPRMIRIRSQTREDIMKRLIKLGVLTSDGEIAQSYIDQFKENGSSYGSLSE